MALNVELLEQSFEQIKPRGNQFVTSFYENLFRDHPEVQPLFANTTMVEQPQRLLQALVFTIQNLRDPEALGTALQAMGARHVRYGTIPQHYPAVGQALLLTFEQYLQDDWTPELQQAWTDAYEAIVILMLKGAESVSKVE